MPFDDKFAFVFLLSRRIRRKKRRYWIHPLILQRSEWGEHLKVEAMLSNYPELFSSYTRLSPIQFEEVLEQVGPLIVKQDTPYRQALSVTVRLFVTLRYLATGDNMRTIATSYSIGTSTTWMIVRETTVAVWTALSGKYLQAPVSPDDWTKIADGFQEKWQFPNCIGSIDGKHVVIDSPPKSGSMFYNYKGTFSIVLMATCDAEYRFTTVDVGAFGRQSDGGIFSTCPLGKALQEGRLVLPAPGYLPRSTSQLPFCFVGDEAFPLRAYMMRPYPGRNLTRQRRVFNYRLSRARRVIENSFGIMATRFRIFRKPIHAYPEHVENIVKACTTLHNFLRTKDLETSAPRRRYCPPGYVDEDDRRNGQWRQNGETNALRDIGRLSSNMHCRMAKEIRDQYTTYFNGEGSVPWQLQAIGIEN